MIASLLLALIRAYQRFVSPLLGPACRFTPSCSHYAAGCIATHGALRGGLLSAVRLCKCHPFHAGGLDPVPPPPLLPPGFWSRVTSLVPTGASRAGTFRAFSARPAASLVMPGAVAPSPKAPSNGS